MTFIFRYLFPHFAFFCCFGKAVFRDCGTSRISLLLKALNKFVAVSLFNSNKPTRKTDFTEKIKHHENMPIYF